MEKRLPKELVINATVEGVDEAQEYVESMLKRASVSKQLTMETLLVFEAVYSAMLMQGVEEDTELTISTQENLGNTYVKIGFAGKRFVPPEDDPDGMAPELRIMEGYADKISYDYQMGYNNIRIAVRKSLWRFFFLCFLGIIAAVFAYAFIDHFMSDSSKILLLEEYIYPIEHMFANAMLMVGAPVTFFSLLKNASDTFIVYERGSNAQWLRVKSLLTSILAILLAIAVGFLATVIIPDWQGYEANFAGLYVERGFSDIVVAVVPSSIFEPFESISPMPLIVVALLVTYALCSAGKDFVVLKSAIDACYGLFSRMLSAIMIFLPFACFLAILDILIKGGFEMFAKNMVLIVIAAVSVSLLFVTYALRLFANGIKVRPFLKKLWPLLRENAAIGSVIDAVPFNVRYCARRFGMDRTRATRNLSILAQINLDGNCFLLMLITMLYIFVSDTKVPLLNLVVIAALVLFLSFGAPNQPGSILIGTLIIITYLSSYSMLCMAFYLEVFLGVLMGLVNVASCIIMAAEEEVAAAKDAASPELVGQA